MNKRDAVYLEICNAVAKNSKCLSRKIGTVLVKDNIIIGTGYNGPPRGFHHCEQRYILDPELKEIAQKNGDNIFELMHKMVCPRHYLKFKSGEGLDWCVASHGERSALINCARLGIETIGATLYMNCPVPCTQCLVEIINAGVTHIVVTEKEFYDRSSKYIIENCDLGIRLFAIDGEKDGEKY